MAGQPREARESYLTNAASPMTDLRHSRLLTARRRLRAAAAAAAAGSSKAKEARLHAALGPDPRYSGRRLTDEPDPSEAARVKFTSLISPDERT